MGSVYSVSVKSDNWSSPFAAPVGGTNRTRDRRSVEVTKELGVRHTHLQRQVFTQLEAVVTGKRKMRRMRKRGREEEKKRRREEATTVNFWPLIVGGAWCAFENRLLMSCAGSNLNVQSGLGLWCIVLPVFKLNERVSYQPVSSIYF